MKQEHSLKRGTRGEGTRQTRGGKSFFYFKASGLSRVVAKRPQTHESYNSRRRKSDSEELKTVEIVSPEISQRNAIGPRCKKKGFKKRICYRVRHGA